MGRALKASIDTAALKHNLNVVRAKAPKSKVIAMIKANGYGHGLVAVAKALHESEAFGVACIEEAMKLRAAGIQNRILLMEGFFKEQELNDIVGRQLEPVIHHAIQVQALIEREKQILDKMDKNSGSRAKIPKLKIWIKVDTGMHRLGFALSEFKQVNDLLNTLKTVEIQGYLSHFPCADELENPKTVEQIALFEKVMQGIPQDKSLANSAAIFNWPKSHADWVRPGIMLYGVSPFANQLGADLGLIPAMTLTTSLIAIQSLNKGDTVGYGGIFVCPEPMRVGVVAVGYADGYPRLAPHGTPVLLNGQKVPIVGRVAMDMLTIDLRGQEKAKVGDTIELWGPHLPVEQVAAHIGTLGYELLTSLSTRVPIEIQ